MDQGAHHQEVKDFSKGLILDFDSAWNNRDAEALALLFHKEADFRFYNGLTLRGQRLIKRFYSRNVFPNLPDGLRHRTRSATAGQRGS